MHTVSLPNSDGNSSAGKRLAEQVFYTSVSRFSNFTSLLCPSRFILSAFTIIGAETFIAKAIVSLTL